MTVVDFIYIIIITYCTWSLARWRSPSSLSWRRRRASAFRSWPTPQHNILSYGANRRPIVVRVRTFFSSLALRSDFFLPSTSSSTLHALYTEYICAEPINPRANNTYICYSVCVRIICVVGGFRFKYYYYCYILCLSGLSITYSRRVHLYIHYLL